jgi:hypothetical protein
MGLMPRIVILGPAILPVPSIWPGAGTSLGFPGAGSIAGRSPGEPGVGAYSGEGAGGAPLYVSI